MAFCAAQKKESKIAEKRQYKAILLRVRAVNAGKKETVGMHVRREAFLPNALPAPQDKLRA